MRVATLLTILALFCIPASGEPGALVPEAGLETPAEVEATADSMPVVELQGMVAGEGLVIESDRRPVATRGGCSQACVDQCIAEYEACRATCAPYDIQCKIDCRCQGWHCTNACGCAQDPILGCS